MFEPRCCPYRDCPRHIDLEPDFYVRHGTYHPRCRPHPVQRFRCRTCERTFSRQTFRADYRDKKPHLNADVLESFSCGVGIRQTARTLGMSRRCLELKLRKICRHLTHFNLNQRGQLSGEATFVFDELETYEGQRNTRPVTVPVLVEAESRFIVWAESATIRPSGKMTEKRKKAVKRSEARHGRRVNRHRGAVRRTLLRGAEMVEGLEVVTLLTDEKSTYPALAREAFGRERLVHKRTNSTVARTTWNPLFPVNHEEAIMRDLMGRLRRESWLVSKERGYLDLALQLHMAYRNYVRKRFNTDRDDQVGSPAQKLGFLPRRLTLREVLSWPQDWGDRSVYPLSRTGRTVGEVAMALAAA